MARVKTAASAEQDERDLSTVETTCCNVTHSIQGWRRISSDITGDEVFDVERVWVRRGRNGSEPVTTVYLTNSCGEPLERFTGG